MSNLSNFQYPPPKNWQDFESLCKDLWQEIWKDSNTQKNGRSGQSQHGVDVFGQTQDKKLWVGIQCKGKDNNLGKIPTEKELEDEVEKAKNFTPSLSSWILATTAPRDAKIQQKAREITKKHKKEKLFTISVWSWEDIIDELVNYPSLITKHLPQINNIDSYTRQKIDDVEVRTQSIESNLDNQTAEIESVSHSVANIEKKVDGVQNIRTHDILTPEYNAEIDDIRGLVNEHQYKNATKAFLKLKKRIWSNASDKVKYRILANLGNAYYAWGKLEKAGSLFIEAYQYNPDDEHSLTNLSIAYSFQSEFEKTEKYARQVLEKNPSSLNGYSILLQIPPYKDSLNVALELIPEGYRKEPLIAFCLGLSAQNENKFDLALEWFEIALENDTEDSPDFKASIAIMLMQSLWYEQSSLLFGQVSNNDKEILERALSLLTKAWEKIENTDLKEVHPVWLLNLGIAKKLLGNIDEAFNDIKKAYDIKPSNPEFIKHLALIILRTNDTTGVHELLEKIRNNPNIPEVSTILADIYNSIGESEKALSIIKDFLQWNEDEQLKFLAYRILVDIYLKLEDEKNVQIYLNKLLREFANTVSTYVSAARVSRKKNNNQEASEFLLKGQKLISEQTHITDLVELGDEFFAFGLFKEAAECYEIFTDIEQDTRFTLSLLVSYYNAGILSKALNLCQTIRKKFGILLKHTEIEIGILEEINNLSKAKKLAIKYLKDFPDNLSVKLRLARLNYLLGNFSEIDSFLDETYDLSNISLDDGLTISALLAQRGRIKESFDLMYELRRYHFAKADAHSFYVTNFFFSKKKSEEWLNSEKVIVDVAVCIERVDGEKEWYVIEDRPNADFQKREFHIGHSFIQHLLGKEVGDDVKLKQSLDNEELAKIVEIKNKYVYALHETMRIYETMFPDQNDLRSIHIENTDVDGEKKTDFKKVHKMVASRSKRVDEVISAYQWNPLTIGAVADLLGLTAYEAWARLLSNSSSLTFCSDGNPKTLEDAISILSSNEPPKLVSDITSIHLAKMLNVENKIVSHFGKLLIAPTTLFSLYRKLEETKKNRESGFLSLSESDGVIYRNEVTPEDIENHIVYLKDLIKWIKGNCVITPHQTGFDIERKYKNLFREALLPECFDTSLIVKDKNYILFTEDERLSQVSKNELEVQRTWMQPVLITLMSKGIITQEEYRGAVYKLALTNLSHIHFDISTLLKAAEESNWNSDIQFKQVIKRIQGGRADLESAANLVLTFLIKIGEANLSYNEWRRIIINILSNFLYYRNEEEAINVLIEKASKTLFFSPQLNLMILRTIEYWKKYQYILR